MGWLWDVEDRMTNAAPSVAEVSYYLDYFALARPA